MSEVNVPTHTDTDYWLKRWKVNEIDFHRERAHPVLEKHMDKLIDGRESIRIFFPLCGKAVDLAMFYSLGHEVVGIEASKLAIEQFFSENNIKYTAKKVDDFTVYSSDDGKLKIYEGDFFKLSTKYEKPFDCVWDRGSFVAIPIDWRKIYVDHILTLLDDNFKYLIETFDYDTTLYCGPPHCTVRKDIDFNYGDKCNVELVETSGGRCFNDKLEEKPPVSNYYLFTKK